MKKLTITLMIMAVAVMMMQSVFADENQNRALWSKTNYIQSAKIQYQHVYKKSKLRDDLYHCIDLIKDATAKYPKDPELYYMVGTFYAEINAIDTVVAYFDSVEMYCADETVDENLRKNCYKKENYKKKMDQIRLNFWEQAYNKAVDFIEQYDTVVSWIKNAPTEDSARALDSLKQAAFDAAKGEFDDALVAMPMEPQTYDGLAALLQREEKYQEAIDVYKKQYDLVGEENGDIVGKLAYAYIYASDWENAAKWFEKFLEFAPKDVNALINLSVSYNNLDEYDKAYDYTEKWLELEPKNTQALFNAGQYWMMKMQDAAIAASDMSDSSGAAAEKRKEFEQSRVKYMVNAEDKFERIIAVDKQDLDALRQLGILYLISGDSSKIELAIKQFETYESINPSDIAVLEYLGRAYIMQGMTGKAIEPYEKIVENDPGNANAWERLAELYEYNGMLDKAKNAKAKYDELKNL